jgi:8-amino-7-oxononanoate synthase
MKEGDFRKRTLRPAGESAHGRIILGGKSLVDFSSNDYLGLKNHPALIKGAWEALNRWGAGSGASRLMSGDLELHHELEDAVSFLVGKEDALLFGSGYLANIGIISALFGGKDAIFFDRFCHASMIDGIRLSGARFFRFRHNDTGHLEHLLQKNRGGFNRALILAESLYSMEGDIAPLQRISELRNRYETLLMVDEAHAIGVFGNRGQGLLGREMNKSTDINLGTFGKALGSYGAYAAISKKLKDQLINHARSFIFSTALPPPILGANLAAIKMLEDEPERRERVRRLSFLLREKIKNELSLDTPGESQIIPVILGSDERAGKVSQRLEEKGFYVRPIRPPTIPEGSSRIRISVTGNHTEGDILALAEAIKDAL